MSQIELLLQLYRLTLRAPERLDPQPLGAWLQERQTLINRLEGTARATPPKAERAVARVLLAAILHLDDAVQRRMLTERRRLQGMLGRKNPYFS